MNGIRKGRRDFEVAGAAEFSYSSRYPFPTFKCAGPAVFRSQEARDYACLLDLQTDVAKWACRSTPLLCSEGGHVHYLDFVSEYAGGETLIDIRVEGMPEPPQWVASAAQELGFAYVSVVFKTLGLHQKIANARELAAYARYRASLGDRIRLLATLQEAGTLTLSECLSCVREGSPMPTVAALIFAGFLEVDLDVAPLGPDTAVRARSE